MNVLLDVWPARSPRGTAHLSLRAIPMPVPPLPRRPYTTRGLGRSHHPAFGASLCGRDADLVASLPALVDARSAVRACAACERTMHDLAWRVAAHARIIDGDPRRPPRDAHDVKASSRRAGDRAWIRIGGAEMRWSVVADWGFDGAIVIASDPTP